MNVALLPYHCNAVDILARRIISEQRSALPDLSGVVVILADYHSKAQLMRLLSHYARQQNHLALIPPCVFTLRDYILQTEAERERVLTEEQRVLHLMDELQQHAKLFGESNLWTVADALLKLFDELTLHKVELPADLNDFIRQLERAYQLEAKKLSAIGVEAKMIHTLWRAWHAQLHANQQIDPATHYLLKLQQAIEVPDTRPMYLAGLTHLLPAERDWLQHVLTNRHATLLLHGCASDSGFHPDTQLFNEFGFCLPARQAEDNDPPYSLWLNNVFATDLEHFAQRARRAAECRPTLRVRDRLRLIAAATFEEEAYAIELQIRIWLGRDRKKIALVLENRQLSRRVRALLERANIRLRDAAGWALSTTSAAAALESWLQSVEEDFAWRPLLDTLKSPLTCGKDDTAVLRRQELVFHFENDIIRLENVSRGLARYQRAIQSRRLRAHIATSDVSDALDALLSEVEQAAAPLTVLRNTGKHPAQFYIQALSLSIEKLGMRANLTADPAGKALVLAISQLGHAAAACPLELEWSGFRAWLGRNLEQHTFIPELPGDHAIDLVQPQQSVLQHYDAVIIGGLTRDQYPGASNDTPFFNNAVRVELGLPSRQAEQTLKFYHFRRLLESADHVLLTYHRGESESMPSPWVELLDAFHQLGFGASLLDDTLLALARHPDTEIHRRDQPLPGASRMPAVTMPLALLPESFSASAHQTLIDCPYAFFVASGLQLQAPEEVRETMAKNEYGARVHRCLEAFHQGVTGLPGPFPFVVTQENCKQAEELLQRIATIVFHRDVETNFEHRGWLKRWQAIIPRYIQWQAKWNENWRIHALESKTKAQLNSSFSIHGRIDRVDTGPQGYAIIDYKTGSSASTDEVLAGEAVQLLHYVSTFDKPINTALNLTLDQGNAKVKTVVEDTELEHAAKEVRDRLSGILEQISEHTPLRAWGDEKTCGYCRFSGICRHGSWND